MPDLTDPTPHQLLAAIQAVRLPTDTERRAIYGFDRLEAREVGDDLLATADRAGRRAVISFGPESKSGRSVFDFELYVLDRLDEALTLCGAVRT